MDPVSAVVYFAYSLCMISTGNCFVLGEEHPEFTVVQCIELLPETSAKIVAEYPGSTLDWAMCGIRFEPLDKRAPV